jgi:hypothetical protein
VNDIEQIPTIDGFHPEFAHQHFGESYVFFYFNNIPYFSEKIIGYKNLDISLVYSDASMFLYPEIKYDTKVAASQDIEVSSFHAYFYLNFIF